MRGGSERRTAVLRWGTCANPDCGREFHWMDYVLSMAEWDKEPEDRIFRGPCHFFCSRSCSAKDALAKRRKMPHILDTRIVELWNSGMSTYEIAELLKVGRGAVHGRLRTLGIAMRGRRMRKFCIGCGQHAPWRGFRCKACWTAKDRARRSRCYQKRRARELNLVRSGR